MGTLESDLKISVLASLPAGYEKDHIKVTFSKGSVVAKVDITPKAGDDTVALQTEVAKQQTAIESASLKAVQDLPEESLNKILADGKTKADLTVTSSAPVEESTPSSTDASGAQGAHLASGFGASTIFFLVFALQLKALIDL